MNTSVTGIKFELAPGKLVLYLSALIELAMSHEKSFSPRVNRSRYQTCAFKYQKLSGRSMISWLLLLIMITGPFQASFALHSNLNTNDRQTQTLVAQLLLEAAVDSEKHRCNAEYCQSLSACAAHFNCTPISLPGPPQLSVQAQFYHHHPVADVAVSTRFPDLLKRPPRS